MGINCVDVDLLLYSLEVDAIHGLLKNNERKITRFARYMM